MQKFTRKKKIIIIIAAIAVIAALVSGILLGVFRGDKASVTVEAWTDKE